MTARQINNLEADRAAYEIFMMMGQEKRLFTDQLVALAKDIAKAFSGLALTLGSCAGITFNTCKYFAKADKTERAMLQKDREEIYREKKRLHLKQQEMYRKEIEKRAADK